MLNRISGSKDADNRAGLMVRDALTGVYAKVALLERLEEEIHRGRRYGDAFSVLLLDLDHFKSVNDAFGHARGDASLTEFVARVQRAARNSDVLFRYGGDEFVLFLPRTTHEHAKILAERLLEEVTGTPFSGQPPLTLSTSIGVATLPEDGSTAEELLARADARMYEAKRQGGGCVVSVDPTRDAEVLLDEGTRLIERLEALDRANRFFDTLPMARRGVLRITGPSGSGKSRVVRELAKLAGLRGHRVISLVGGREKTSELLALLQGQGSEPGGALGVPEAAEVLKKTAPIIPGALTILTLDGIAEIERPTLDAVRNWMSGGGATTPIALIHTGSDAEADPAPPDVPLRSTIELQPLTREGVRAWMRSIFRWEPPVEFVEWVHEQTGGIPGRVRALMLQLAERRMLLRDDSKWALSEEFQELAGERQRSVGRGYPRGLLPPVHTLIGREGALRQILRLLRTSHLVTLTGPGGLGKTRLAIEIAMEASEAFRDGVAVVNAQPHMTATQLAGAVARTLDLPGLQGPHAWLSLARQIRNQNLLLVIDGCENVAQAAEGIMRLLEHAPDVRVLATSRRRLQLPDEAVFMVEGLRCPKWTDADRARGFSSVLLFTERATNVNPHFSLGEAEAPAVARICQLLDGSPLALEIIAAQTAGLSCREVADDLESALEGIGSYLPALPADQQRFRAAMELAWRLLSEESRWFLRRVAVFASEFDADASACVAGVNEASLDQLQVHGLLSRDTAGRYVLQPLVREFALHKFDEFSRERNELLCGYSRYYLERAISLGERLRDSTTAAGAAMQFSADLDNIRRAWLLALKEQEELVLGGARALYEYFAFRELQTEAVELFQSGVDWLNAGAGDDPHITQMAHARLGAALVATGAIEGALPHATRALTLARRLNMAGEEGFCLRQLALIQHGLGNTAVAEDLANQAIAMAQRSGDPHVLVHALRDAGWIVASGTSPDRSVDLLLDAVSVEGPSTAKTRAWRMLMDATESLASQGNVVVPAAALIKILRDRSAEPDVLTRAERLLEWLRSRHPTTTESRPDQRSESVQVRAR